jgi:hypothetical protein
MGILSCKGNGNIMAGSEDRREICGSMGRSASTKLRPVIVSRVRPRNFKAWGQATGVRGVKNRGMY